MKIQPMKATEFFRWWVPDERRPGRLRLTTYRMTREQAGERFPGAAPELASLEVRSCPENEQEALALTHNGRGRTPGA